MTLPQPPDGPSLLLRGGTVYSPADPRATAVLVAGDTITWVGDAADAPAADAVVELDGCLVTPAFVDAHAHATATGLALTGLNLGKARSAADLLDALAAHCSALPAGASVIGHGWDDSGWTVSGLPTAEQLERAGGGRRVYLARVDEHSALATPGLATPGLATPGLATPAPDTPDPDRNSSALVIGEAHHAARAAALDSLSTTDRRRAQRAFLRHAAALGIGALHECAGPRISSEDDLTDLLALATAEPEPEIFAYWGEIGAVDRARELGALGAGGDLFADGSVGSRTAALRTPYADDPSNNGTAYLEPGQVAEHVVASVRAGAQPGFHAIGDRAIDVLLAGLSKAAAVVGAARLRAARPRIEHAELVHPEHLKALVEHGVVASVQPAFDAAWGGPHGMYARALGVARAERMNPLAAFAGVGVPMAFGSDSPVTPLDPWGTVRAAAHHVNPVQRLSERAAFAAHTRGGWRAIGQDTDGVLVPGAPATLAVWQPAGGSTGPGGLPDLSPGAPIPVCLLTMVRGTTIHSRDRT